MARTRQEEREYIPQQIRWQVFKDCRETCAHCGCHLVFKRNFTLEHVIPLNKGGKNDISNFVALCYDCNKAKSDDIIEPLEYYKHLPEEKLKSLKALFDAYLETTDWLSYNTLFQKDQFDLPIQISVKKPRASKPVLISSTARIEKMRPAEIIDYMLLYGARLNTYDKELLVYDEKDIGSDFYRVFRGETLIMVISTYIRKSSLRTDFNPEGESRNMLYFDIFVNPELPIRSEDTFNTMYFIVDAIIMEIKKTLAKSAGPTGIECFVRVPWSDKIGFHLMERCVRIQGYAAKPAAFSFGGDLGEAPAIAGFSTILFHGTKSDTQKLLAETNCENISQLIDANGVDLIRSDLDNRLSDSPNVTPKPHKKFNPKKKGKKSNPKRHKH